MTTEHKWVIPFEQLRMADLNEVGGKNASLGEMVRELASRAGAANGLGAAQTVYVVPRLNPDASEAFFAPVRDRYKVYIIDEVHMLSQAAFNAFLKTLEEPPPHAVFILATTEKHKILPTILSRCQIFDFHRISVPDAVAHLQDIASQEGVTAEEEALHVIAQKADGAMRDALSIFDRVVSFCGNNLTRQAVTENLNVLDYETYINVTELILENKIPELLVAFNEILSKGFDAHHFVSGLASHFRDLLVSKNPATLSLLEVGEQAQQMYGVQAQKCDANFLLKGIEIANDCDLKYKVSQNQRLLVELCLMQLASITFDGEKKKLSNL